MATIESVEEVPPQRTIIRRKGGFFWTTSPEEERIEPSTALIPFQKPVLGDLVKPI